MKMFFVILVALFAAPATAQVDGQRIDEGALSTIFGLKLGEFIDLPACASDKYFGYRAPKDGGCAENAAAVGTSSSFTGATRLKFWALVLPTYVAGDLEVEVIDGKLESIRINTRGLMTMILVTTDLQKKLGSPHSAQSIKLKTLRGEVDSTIASWHFANFDVTHIGAIGSINSGVVTFATPAGNVAYKKRIDEVMKATQGSRPL